MFKATLVLGILQVLLVYIRADVDPTRVEAQNDDFTFSHVPGNGKFRMAAKDESLRWRNATIVYQVALPAFEDSELEGLREVMDIFEKETCLKFRIATPEDKYSVIIRKGSSGCNAILGQYVKTGIQTVNLDYGCRFYGLFLHELGHTIGLHHEHQHPDRDQGVKINMQNVDERMRQWFNPIDRKELNMYGVEYDMQSIMHYGQHAFSTYDSNGKQKITIVANDPAKQKYLKFVYMKDMSWGDAKRINLMYKCNAHCPKNIRCDNGFITKDCKCETPQAFAKRRCFDKLSAKECEEYKPKCNDTNNPNGMYHAYYNCRKTCDACYEAP